MKKSKKFIPQYEPTMRLSYIIDVAKQMLSGWVGTGTRTEEFEEMIKDITKAKHVISTTSGSMALYLGIDALNIPKNKKIIFPAYTFLAAANVCKELGYEVELCEVSEKTMCIDPDKLKIDKNVGAVIFVNHNGYVGPDVFKVRSLCEKAGVPMIEDSSQAIGIKHAGTVGVFGCFSFSVPKLITTGQGGVLFTNDDALAERAKQIRDQGDNWRKDKLHKFTGLNLKFNDILAMYGISQLKRLGKLLNRRESIFNTYRRELNIMSKRIIDFDYPSTWMVIYKTDYADKIIAALKELNIQAVKYYRPVNENLPFQDGKIYEVSKMIYDKYLYLPSALSLKKSVIKDICQTIKKIEGEEALKETQRLYNEDLNITKDIKIEINK